MKTLLLISLVAFISTICEAAPDCEYDGKTYESGETFKEECNRCKCGKNGKIMCTQRTCGSVCDWKDCSNVPCPLIGCPQGSYTPPGKCCPVCKMPARTMVATACSPVTCRMYCQFGFKKDETGCEICKCNNSPCDVDPSPCPEDSDKPVCVVRNKQAVCVRQICPPICAMHCEYGFKVNATTNCPICSCRANPCAEPNPCPDDKPYCLVQNKKATCQKCSPVQCRMFCPYGFKKDENDCDICECKKSPCDPNECPPETPYCMVQDKEAVCMKCSPVMCMMFCEYGFERNDRGCPICSCKRSPCEDELCPDRHICEVQRSECENKPCPLNAVCKVDPKLPCEDPEGNATDHVHCHNDCDCSAGYICKKFGDNSACCPVKQCAYNGKTYDNGAGFPSSDGCNTCFCNNGAVGCTLMLCPNKNCVHNGNDYLHGSTFPRGDGCNNCFCRDGNVACTRAYCAHCKKDGIMYPIGESVKGDGICEICQCVNDITDPLRGEVVCAIVDCPDEDMIDCDVDVVTDDDHCCPYCPSDMMK